MFGKIRVIPIVILAAMMLLGIKVVELHRGVADIGFATAWAQSKDSKGKKAQDNKEKAGQSKAQAAKAKAAKAEMAAGAKTPAPMDDGTEKAAKKNTSKGGKDGTTKMASRSLTKKTRFTPAEIEVLQKLSDRREALEQRSQQMAMREKILQATEKRIDNKIGELKKLEERIQGLLQEHDKEAEKQIESLVKVYENMKPKQAARIFEELEMDILLDVTERMKEVKMAKVLAAMNPNKAKSLTVELATRRRLPKTGG